MRQAKISATGSYLPKKILTNYDLEKLVETTDEWIITRTGIKQRHIADKNQVTSDLAYEAVLDLVKHSDVKIEEIEMIIVATTTPDLTFPSTATILQSKLGAKNAFSFDLQAVCSGFIYALSTANNFIKTGQVRNALVIGAETISRIIDWKDRNSCVLFGDGAGAVFLEVSENENLGILATNLYSDGNLGQILKTDSGVSTNQKSGNIHMLGKEVFKHAVEKMSLSIESILEKTGYSKDDISLIIPHQANKRILLAVANRLDISEHKIVMTVDKHSNTSAASIPLALNDFNRAGKIKSGDLIIMEALGGGLTWGAAAIRW